MAAGAIRRIAPGTTEKDFVAGRTVLRAQPVDRGTQAPRARAVEVRDLDYPHEVNQNRHACSVNNATSTGT